jgi:hypothetical protein
MSEGYIIMSSKTIRSESLSVYEKVLLGVLLSYKNCEILHPSHETLAKQAGMSRGMIIITQKKLIRKGYITIKKDPSYRSNTYKLTKKAVHDINSTVHHVNSSVHEKDRGCSPHEQGGVHDMNTNNISINNISIDKKNKEIISKIIEMYNSLNDKKKDINNSSHHKRINSIIKELKKMKIREEAEILSKFKFVFTNQKLIAEDPNEFWHHYNFDTLTYKTNFFKYLDKEPHKKKIAKKIVKKEEGKGLKFIDLEYPVCIDSLTFESPGMLGGYIKDEFNEPQRIEFIGRLKERLKICKCGQKFITENDRALCFGCKERR